MLRLAVENRVRMRARWFPVVCVAVFAAVVWLAASGKFRIAGLVDHAGRPDNAWWPVTTGSRTVYPQPVGDRVSTGRVPVAWTDEVGLMTVMPPVRRAAVQRDLVNGNGGAFVRTSRCDAGHPRRAPPVDV